MSNTPDELNKQLKEAIWQTIKGWDLERKKGDGYAGATGTDVDAIMSAIQPVLAQHREAAERKGRKHALNWFIGTLEHNSQKDTIKLAEMQLDHIKQQPELQEDSDER